MTITRYVEAKTQNIVKNQKNAPPPKETKPLKMNMNSLFNKNSTLVEEKEKENKEKTIKIESTKTQQLYSQGLNRLIQQTYAQLEPPIMDHIERKLQIFHGEKFKESTYYNDEIACLYFNWNPTEGPFIIVPSMDSENKTASYKLTIFSNNPVDLVRLDEKKNAVLIGKWETDISDGGCHLWEEPYQLKSKKKTWTLNPKFLLNFLEPIQPVYLKITLAIAEKNWKGRKGNVVGSMIGIYLIEKKETKIVPSDAVREPSFVPLYSTFEEYDLNEIPQNGFYIMPTTYDVN